MLQLNNYQLEIIPDTHDGGRRQSQRILWTYLHGKLMLDCGYDIYGFKPCGLPPREEEGSNAVDVTNLEKGIYKCTYKDKPCLLYFWDDKYSTHGQGLVIYEDDLEAKSYVEECYKNNESFI